MANFPPQNEPVVNRDPPCTAIAPQAVVILISGMIAAWLAAGSTGLFAHSFQHAMTWLTLAVAVGAGWPREKRSLETWAILAIGAALGFCFTASALPTINVLAVAVVLSAISQVNRGLSGRVSLITAMAAAILAIYRFSCDCFPMVWLAADLKGWVLGYAGGWMAGNPLQVGATFGGLDFLVFMTAIYIGWLACTERPRLARALWAAAAIVIGHFAYLAVLANSENLLAALPDMVAPKESDINHVGIWTIGNGLRMLIPWNVPLLAVLINVLIAVAMFRWSQWLPVIELDPKALKKQKEKEEKEEVPGKVLAVDMLFRFGPPLLAVAATLLVGLGVNHSDLKGKTIVAYEKGYVNWLKPEYDSTTDGFYGLLPTFVESLGGKFVLSKELSEQDLAQADVLILIHPDEPWPEETLQRVLKYAYCGGSLLVAADPAIHEGNSQSSFNEVLKPTSMRVRQDTAVTRTGNWEQSYEVMSHPAVAGMDDWRNHFGFELGSSIRTRWPARPVLVGRWGWSDPGSDAVLTGESYYNAGESLGDLVLAAEQSFGNGRVFVLGNTSPLKNEMLANAYPFVGRMLGYLAHRPSNPQMLWRQILGLIAVLGLIALLAFRPAAWQVMSTSAVLAIALAGTTAAGYWSGRVLPDGRLKTPGGFNNVAYIDASHVDAYSGDLWNRHGIAGLLRTLMRQGYLPLLTSDLTRERLERAGLLISIGPARRFSAEERDVVKNFVGNGGTLICMVGAEESKPSTSLLADFQFAVPHSPVAPSESVEESEPLGAFQQLFGEISNKRYVRFYAGWPVDCEAAGQDKQVVWSNGVIDRPIVVSQSEQGGTVVVIGDTRFACNDNLEDADVSIPDNIRFWHWLLSRAVRGQKPWNPPPATGDTKGSSTVKKVEEPEESDSEESN